MDIEDARQRRRLKGPSRRAREDGRGIASKPLALVMTALTLVCLAVVGVLFGLGTLTGDRIAGDLLIPTVLLVVADVYLWSRVSDDAHPVRHPIRFVRARLQARTQRRLSPSARELRMRGRRPR